MEPNHELPPPDQSGSGQPGGGVGRVDVTGRVPDNVRVDPDITEGHPGYQESGDSEIIPPERLAHQDRDVAEGKKKGKK